MKRYGRETTTVTARPGEEFALDLPTMATAGYQWRCEDPPKNVRLVDETIAPAGPGIGASSVQGFVFRAERIGTQTLRLVYGQPWGDAEEELAVRISVREKG